MKYAVILGLFCTGIFASCQQEQKATESPQSENAPTPQEALVNAETSGTEEYKEVYSNGNLKIKGTKVNGKREGLWVSYYQDGTKWSETTFKEGVKTGPTSSYYENGMMRYTGRYKDDLKTGIWKFYNEEGKLEKTLDLSTEVENPTQSDSL